MIAALSTPIITFIVCAVICLFISKHKDQKFSQQFAELMWPLAGFAIVCAIIASFWVLIAYSDVAQGALLIFVAAPIGASIGEALGLTYWAVKKSKHNQ
jgi:uncharacterized membrane protein YoaK (UPF0700 family)